MSPLGRAETPVRYDLYAGVSYPELGISDWGPCGANMAFTSGDSLAADTRGVLTDSVADNRDNSFLLWALVNGRSNAEYNHGIIIYWPLDKLPQNLQIQRAWIEFFAVPNTSNYIAGADEKVPIRRITDPENRGLWSFSYHNVDDGKWRGASWRWMHRDSADFSNGTPWSTLPRTGQYGFTGDLSSVLDPITSSTARISFAATAYSKAISTDITTDVLKIVRRQVPNRGFYVDPQYIINRNYNPSFPNRMFQVGICGHFNSDVNRRMRVMIEAVPPKNAGRMWTIYE